MFCAGRGFEGCAAQVKRFPGALTPTVSRPRDERHSVSGLQSTVTICSISMVGEHSANVDRT